MEECSTVYIDSHFYHTNALTHVHASNILSLNSKNRSMTNIARHENTKIKHVTVTHKEQFSCYKSW